LVDELILLANIIAGDPPRLAHAREGNAQIIGIVGEAGLGKSRLCFGEQVSAKLRKLNALPALQIGSEQKPFGATCSQTAP